MTLGTVVSINEQGGSMPIPVLAAMGTTNPCAAPIKSGEPAVNVTLSVSYELVVP